jgi:hypothetical protein
MKQEQSSLEQGMQEFLRPINNDEPSCATIDFRRGCKIALADQKQKIKEWVLKNYGNQNPLLDSKLNRCFKEEFEEMK